MKPNLLSLLAEVCCTLWDVYVLLSTTNELTAICFVNQHVELKEGLQSLSNNSCLALVLIYRALWWWMVCKWAWLVSRELVKRPSQVEKSCFFFLCCKNENLFILTFELKLLKNTHTINRLVWAELNSPSLALDLCWNWGPSPNGRGPFLIW